MNIVADTNVNNISSWLQQNVDRRDQGEESSLCNLYMFIEV